MFLKVALYWHCITTNGGFDGTSSFASQVAVLSADLLILMGHILELNDKHYITLIKSSRDAQAFYTQNCSFIVKTKVSDRKGIIKD